MLDDSSRKILRILWNLYRMNATQIDINRLYRMSGRNKNQTAAALKRLQEERYVLWDKESSVIQVIEAEERQPIKEWNWRNRII